jgi:hypothetical protein
MEGGGGWTQSKTTYQLFGGMVIIPVVVGGNHQRQQHVEAQPQAKESVSLELPHCLDLGSTYATTEVIPRI